MTIFILFTAQNTGFLIVNCGGPCEFLTSSSLQEVQMFYRNHNLLKDETFHYGVNLSVKLVPSPTLWIA